MSTKQENVPNQQASVLGVKSNVKPGDLPPSSMTHTGPSSLKSVVSGGGMANGTSSSANAAAANANKFSMYNINSQFKGKSIEPKQKANIIRAIPSGLQTLGKVVAARRMPPPTNLPSLAKSTGTVIIPHAPESSVSTSNQQASQQTSNQTNATAGQPAGSESAPITIAAVVSGANSSQTTTSQSGSNNQTWPTPHGASQNPEAAPNHHYQQNSGHKNDTNESGNYKTYSNTTKWGHNEFPDLADAALLSQQQNQAKSVSTNEQSANGQAQVDTAKSHPQYNNGPVLKPSNVGNWGRQMQPQDADELLTDKQLVQNIPQNPQQSQNSDYNNTQNNSNQYYNNSYNSNQNRQQQQQNMHYQNNNQYRQNYNNNMNTSNSYRGQKNQNYRNQNYSSNSKGNSSNNYHSQSYNQYHENAGANYTVPSIVKEKDFNHLDDLINNTQGSNMSGDANGVNSNSRSHYASDQVAVQSNDSGKNEMWADMYAGEDNWAYISQNVDYDEKIQFHDTEEEDEPEFKAQKNEKPHDFSDQYNKPESHSADQSLAAGDDETALDQKRKYNEDEVKKSIERARLRRAEEERRLSEQRQAVCAEKLRQLNLRKQTTVDSPDVQEAEKEQFTATNSNKSNEIVYYDDEVPDTIHRKAHNGPLHTVKAQQQFNNAHNGNSDNSRTYNNNSRNVNYNQKHHSQQQQQHEEDHNKNYNQQPQQAQSYQQHNNKTPGQFNNESRGKGVEQMQKVQGGQTRQGLQSQISPTIRTNKGRHPNNTQETSQTANSQKYFKHVQNIPDHESKMQSLGKRPQSGKPSNVIQNESPFQAEKQNTKPDEAPKPITDQWSTNRLQQTFKNQQQLQQQQQSMHISDTNSNASSMSGSSNTKAVNSSKQSSHARQAQHKNTNSFDHEMKGKRERSGNSESSSSRSFAHKAAGKNVSKEGSTEPAFYQNDNPTQKYQQNTTKPTSNRNRNVQNRSQQQNSNNQRTYHQQQQQSQQYHNQTKPHTNTQNGFNGTYDDNDDEYEDEYTDEEKQDTPDIKPARNQLRSTQAKQPQAPRHSQTNGLNKRSVNISSPASNFRRGGNANNTRSNRKISISEDVPNQDSTNKRSNNIYNSANNTKGYNAYNNNNYNDTYQGHKRTQNYTKSSNGRRVDNQQQQQHRNATQQASTATVVNPSSETVANTSTTNSVLSDNKSTRSSSNRQQSGKQDVHTDAELNDEWETASDSSLVKQNRSEPKNIAPASSQANQHSSSRSTGSNKNRSDTYNNQQQQYNQRPNKYYQETNENGRGDQNRAPNRPQRNPTSQNNRYNNPKSNYYDQQQYNSSYSNAKRGNRPNKGASVEKVIKHDDLRYTAKYWTSSTSDNDSKRMTTEGNTLNENSNTTTTAALDQPQPQLTNQKPSTHSHTSTNNQKSFSKQRPTNQTQQNRSSQSHTSKTHNHRNQNYQSSDPKHSQTKNLSSNNTAQSVNLQVYRVDNIIATNPLAIKDALTKAAPKPIKKVNALQGIDLSNHAGVVIVDYLPETATRNHSNDGQSDEEDRDCDSDNDGFQQVMTKKGKKAEKLKAAQAAAAAAAAAAVAAKNKTNLRNRSSDPKLALKTHKASNSFKPDAKMANVRKTPTPTPIPSLLSTTVKPIVSAMNRPASESKEFDSKTARNSNKDLMTNIETWNNELASPNDTKPAPIVPENATTKPGAQRYNQIVNNFKAADAKVNLLKNTEHKEGKNSDGGPLSPSVDLNLKIESCKKVWETNEKTGEHSKAHKANKSESDSVSSNKKRDNGGLSSKKQPLMSIQTKKIEPMQKQQQQKVSQVAVVSKQQVTETAHITKTSSVTVNASNKSVCTVKPTQQQAAFVPAAALPVSQAAQTQAITTTVTTTTVETAVVSPSAGANADQSTVSPAAAVVAATTEAVAPISKAVNAPAAPATIINHYYDKILINQAAAANTAVAAAATAAAAAATAAVSAAVTVNSMHKQHQHMNHTQNTANKIENTTNSLNISNSSAKSTTSNASAETCKTEPAKVTPQKQQQPSSNDSNNVNQSSSQYTTQISNASSSNAYPLSSSANVNASANTSTMGNVSASPSSSVSSYLSMPSISNNSFGFGQQQQQQQTVVTSHQMFQNFYQPQVMQPSFANQPGKNATSFEEFNQQQEAFALYPAQASYSHHPQLNLQAPPQAALLPSQQQIMSHPVNMLGPQQMYQANRPGIHPQGSMQPFEQQQAFQNQHFFNQQAPGNKILAAAAANSLQSVKQNGQNNKSEFPIAPGTFVSSAISKPASQSQSQQNNPSNNTNSPVISTLQYQQQQQHGTKQQQDIQYFNNFNNFNPFNSNHQIQASNANTNGNTSNNGPLNSSNSNNFFQNNFMSQIASLSLNQQQTHHSNQFNNTNSLNSLFSSSNSNSNTSSKNSASYNQQQQQHAAAASIAASQFGFNSIIQQQQQQPPQQQRQTPSSISTSNSFINANSTNQTPINPLIQMQQQHQKTQFDNSSDSFFSNNNFDSNYFPTNNNANANKSNPNNTNSTINRPSTTNKQMNAQLGSFDNGFNNYSNNHHHGDNKPYLSSVTPPSSTSTSATASSFFNNTSQQNSNGPTSSQRTNSSNYQIDSHQYHPNQLLHHQQQYHFQNQNKNNNLQPALLPQPPQSILGNNNFIKENSQQQIKQNSSTSSMRSQNNYPQLQGQNNPRNQPGQNIQNRNMNYNNFNNNRRPNQAFYNNKNQVNQKQNVTALAAPLIQQNKSSLDSKTIGNLAKADSGKSKLPANPVAAGLKPQKAAAIIQGSSSMTTKPSATMTDKKTSDDLTAKK